MEKIVAMSQIFGVTTDYLLKPSEVDELSAKTKILEKQQQQLLDREKRQNQKIRCLMYSAGIYFIFLAAYLIGHVYLEIWNPSIIFAEFLIATVIVIFIWTNLWKQKE